MSPTGITNCNSPTGSPVRNIGDIAAGQTVTLNLEFTGAGAFNYTPKVIAGIGAR